MDEHCKPRRTNALGRGANLRLVAGLVSTFTFYYTRPNLDAAWPKVQAMLTEAGRLLASADARPSARMITTDGKPLTLCRRYRFVDWEGANEYLAMCRIWNFYRGLYQAKDEARDVEVRFAKRAHVYDVVEGKYLGETDRVKTSFGKADGKVFALLPRKVGRLDVRCRPQAARGQPWSYTVHYAGEGKPAMRRAVRIDVTDPKGEVSYHYSHTETLLGGERSFAIPFALNDAPGTWRVAVRDAMSGQSVVREVNVK